MTETEFPAGYAGTRVRLEPGWRVLDVGSGHNPHPRADVLLEKWVEDNKDRAGDEMDVTDPRLVIGDACAMPFGTHDFDFAMASHVAEHVDDPSAFCREMARVARAGYIETPGWLGDMILREDFHRWRVSRRKGGLHFREVDTRRPFGPVGELFYGILYLDEERPGHRPIRSGRFTAVPLKMLQRIAARGIRLPIIRDAMYTRLEYHAPFPVSVQRTRQAERSQVAE